MKPKRHATSFSIAAGEDFIAEDPLWQALLEGAITLGIWMPERDWSLLIPSEGTLPINLGPT